MEINDTIKNICSQLLDEYKKNIGEHIASGNLANTASYQCKFNGKYFEVYFLLENYWKYLENCTKPHFPPIDKIEEWIRVKPIVPRAITDKVPTTRQLAYLISRKISINGTKPTKILQKTLNSREDLVEAIAEELSNQIINDLNKEIDNEIS